MTPQEIVERALTAAGHLHGCAVLVRETSEAVLRWANSTMTTNGHSTATHVTVIAFVAVDGGVAAGVAGSAALADTAQLVAAAEAAARDAGPADDAAPLPEPTADDPTWADPADGTTVGVFEKLAGDLGAVFDSPQRHYGFASHEIVTTWLGTSTGIRRRWVQPTGSVELNVKTPDLASSAWAGASTRRLHRRRHRRTRRRRRPQAGVGRPPRHPARGPLRNAAAAVGRRRPHDLPGLVDGGQGGAGGAQRALRAGRAARRRAAHGPAADPGLRPGRAGAGVRSRSSPPPIPARASASSTTARPPGASTGCARASSQNSPTPGPRPPSSARRSRHRATTCCSRGGADGSLDELVAATERGLLLTCLWYIRLVDPTTLLLTGLTRDGVYLVEHGEVVAEVDHNFRFNYSPLDVLRRATQVGATERTLPREWKDWFTRAAMPPVRVPEFFMSSVSLGR